VKVLLVGNYPADEQWSMERFCKMLEHGLRDEGVEVEVIRPAVIMGGGNKWLGYFDKFILLRRVLERAMKARSGWVVHILDQGNGIYAGWIPGCVVTCHDMLAIRAAGGEFPEHRPGWTGRVFQRLILAGLRKAKAIACVSEATRQDVARLIGTSEVIANGLEDIWRPIDRDDALTQIAAGVREGGFLLHVGGDQWYKNRAEVIRTFDLLRAADPHPRKLVLVGPPPEIVRDDMIVLSGVSDETLCALYNIAAAMVFPSVAEGFGWPILEAQACGCPVVTTPSMRETGGDGAIYINGPDMLPSVREALEMDKARRTALVAAGMENARKYSARRMAREYVEFYQRHAQ
jgi:glycosyltransferase involved in cell wall biosynthesis